MAFASAVAGAPSVIRDIAGSIERRVELGVGAGPRLAALVDREVLEDLRRGLGVGDHPLDERHVRRVEQLRVVDDLV